MKTRIFYFLLLGLCTSQLYAQNPLVGTWEYKNDSVRSVKIITPTHWMVYTEKLQGSETKFLRAHGGTYTLDGNNYVENIETASWDGFGTEKTDFTIKVAGDKFYQKGLLILRDGTEMPVDEVWTKVTTPNSWDWNRAVGTWDQISSQYTMAAGTKDSHTTATATRFQIITPTHWIRISHRDNKFENVMGGSYNTYGNKVYPKFEYTSFPATQFHLVEIAQRVEGDRLYWKGTAQDLYGKQILSFDDVFQLVPAKAVISKRTVEKL